MSKVDEIIEQCNELLEDKTYFLQTIELTKEEVNVLINEIERLNKELNNYRFRPKTRFRDVIELRDRINKAIEYIETHQLNFKKGNTTFGSERLSIEERKLIDILRGY